MSHNPPTYNAVLIGCGKMGCAMLQAWLDRDVVARILVVNPTPIDAHFTNDTRVTHMRSAPEDGIADADIIIIAVKPQVLNEACAPLAGSVRSDTLILSIAAGQNLETLETIFGQERAIVRAMPNTPAAIGQGMNVAVANEGCAAEHKACARRFLEVTGLFEWVKDETLMDAVTALSGSGPAYIFYMIEALAKAGARMGLEQDMAMRLARQTVIGSAELAKQESDVPAQILRKNVTSPGGTTQAALDVLMDGRFQDLMDEALLSAQKRSVELSR